MNNPESIAIINRFYEAIDTLIVNKAIAGKKSFTKAYNINVWNFNTVRKNPKSDMFQLVWISHIVCDFGISAEWVMTGNGYMFKDKDITVVTKDNKTITLEELQKFDNKECAIIYLPYRKKATYMGFVNVLFNSKTRKVSIKIKSEAKKIKIIKAEDIISIKPID